MHLQYPIWEPRIRVAIYIHVGDISYSLDTMDRSDNDKRWNFSDSSDISESVKITDSIDTSYSFNVFL